MSKVVFLSVPAYGHINFTLQLVQGLVSHGEEVIYYCIPQFKEIVEATGATFLPYHEEIIKNIDNTGVKKLNSNLQSSRFEYGLEMLCNITMDFYSMQEVVVQAMFEEIVGHNPEYIIHDSCASWGKIIAEKARIKAVACYSNIALNDQIHNIDPEFLARNYFKFPEMKLYKNKQDGIKRLRKMVERYIKEKYNIDSFNLFDIYNSHEDLNIIFTSANFQPYVDTFHSSYKFVGPLMSDIFSKRDCSTIKGNKSLIYISLGTFFIDFNVYKILFEALGNINAQIIVSIGKENGKAEVTKYGSIPSNFIVEDFVPQKEVLSKADLFIFHGGTNGVNEALYHGVPMLVIPFSSPDHFIVAEQVEKLKAGIYLKDTGISSNDLQGIVEEMLLNPEYKKNSMQLGDAIRLLDGSKYAIDSIFEYKAEC